MDEGVDILSALPDHLLLSILERIDINSAVSTSILSRRWCHLPWLLSKIRINTKDQYLPLPAFAKTIESFLAAPASERTIQFLGLQFALPDGDVDEKYTNYSNNIGNSIVDAINGGKVTGKVALLIGPDVKAREAEESGGPMRDDACHLMCFTGASTPGVLALLHTLSLCNLELSASENVITMLLSSCKLLEVLKVSKCLLGDWDAVVEIDAPESRLKDLTVEFSIFEIIELHRLPRLTKLACYGWGSSGAPLCFASDSDTPCLQQLTLFGDISNPWQERFELSDLLCNAVQVPHLCFSFLSCKIWIRPEDPKQLAPTLSKLKILDLLHIYYEYDLSWIILILEAAVVLETLTIIINLKNNEEDKTTVVASMSDDFLQKSSNFKHYHLQELRIARFMPKDNQIQFIRLLMERAVNLRNVILAKFNLKKDEDNLSDPLLGSAFPENKGQKDMIVKQLKEKISSPAQIVFWDPC